MKKNIVLCLSLLTFNQIKAVETISTEAAFTPQVCTFNYTVHAKDASHLEQLHTRLHDLTQRNTNITIYQSLVILMQELQAAFTTGLSIFVTASTENEPIAQIVEEVAVEAIAANTNTTSAATTTQQEVVSAVELAETITSDIAAAESATSAATKSTEIAMQESIQTASVDIATEMATTEPTITNSEAITQESSESNVATTEEVYSITFSITGVINNAHDLETWTEIKELLLLLADNINSQTISNDQITETLDIVNALLSSLSSDTPAAEDVVQA